MSLAEVFEEEDYAVDWAAYSLVLELHIHTHMHTEIYGRGGVGYLNDRMVSASSEMSSSN